MSEVRTNLGRVIAWKWSAPFTARGEHVEIEGVGVVPWSEIEAAHDEWVAAGSPVPGATDPDGDLAQAIADATTFEDLKSALLGTLKADQKGRVAAQAKK